jgi:hypothetical protein
MVSSSPGASAVATSKRHLVCIDVNERFAFHVLLVLTVADLEHIAERERGLLANPAALSGCCVSVRRTRSCSSGEPATYGGGYMGILVALEAIKRLKARCVSLWTLSKEVGSTSVR